LPNCPWLLNNNTPLPLVCEATGIITRLTDNRDPKPRAREIFNFPTPATVAEQLNQPATIAITAVYRLLKQPKQPLRVVYNAKIPPEFFDFVVIDECHRSITFGAR
jgi:type I site-specific restriction endonuclease